MRASPGSSSCACSYSLTSRAVGSPTPKVAHADASWGSYGLMPTYGGGMNSEYARSGKRPAPAKALRASATILDHTASSLMASEYGEMRYRAPMTARFRIVWQDLVAFEPTAAEVADVAGALAAAYSEPHNARM